MLDRPVQRDTRRELDIEESGGSVSAAPARVRLPVVKMPRTLAECRGPGLCLKLSCSSNTTLDVDAETGSVRLNALSEGKRREMKVRDGMVTDRCGQPVPPEVLDEFDERVIARLAELDSNCAHDFAERGGMSQVEIGHVLGYTRQRVEQLEAGALRKLSRRPEARALIRRLLGD